MMSTKTNRVVVRFIKLDAIEPIIYLDGKLIPTPTFHIYCPILVRSDTRDSNKMLLNISERRVNRLRKESAVLTFVKQSKLSCAT